MGTIPVILPRRSCRQKNVAREGRVRFRVEVSDLTGLFVGLSAESFWIDWGDGTVDDDLMHTYDFAGSYDVVISGSAINQLNLARCWLKSIDLSECPWLEYLDVSFNFLTKLDVMCCPYLIVLLCGHSLIRELEMGDRLPWLVYLDCSCNQLERLEFPSICGLQYLQADRNQLSNLDFRNCPELHNVDMADNAIPPLALQDALDSLPVVSPGVSAWVMYEFNPFCEELQEEQVRKKGWHCIEMEKEGYE